MGRLQKKKDPEKKKVKRHDASGNADDAAVNPADPSAEAAKRPPVPKKALSVTKAAVAKQDGNFLNKSVQFLREVKIELKKVTWPSRKQTMGSTVVVIVLVMIISLFLGLVDFGLSNLIRAVLQ